MYSTNHIYHKQKKYIYNLVVPSFNDARNINNLDLQNIMKIHEKYIYHDIYINDIINNNYIPKKNEILNRKQIIEIENNQNKQNEIENANL